MEQEKKGLGDIVLGTIPGDLSVFRDTHAHYERVSQQTGKPADELARIDGKSAFGNTVVALMPVTLVAMLHSSGSVTLNGMALSERVWNIVSEPNGWLNLAERCQDRPELLIMHSPVIIAAAGYIAAGYFLCHAVKNAALVYKISSYLSECKKTTS